MLNIDDVESILVNDVESIRSNKTRGGLYSGNVYNGPGIILDH